MPTRLHSLVLTAAHRHPERVAELNALKLAAYHAAKAAAKQAGCALGWAMVWLAFAALCAWVAYGCLPPG